MPDLATLGRLADENLAGAWAAMGRCTGARLGGSDRCTFAATGLPAAFFNGAFVAGPVGDPHGVVADAMAFMDNCAVPWLLWVRDGVQDELLAAGRSAGLTDAGGPPAMALATIEAIPPPPDELTVKLVRDEPGLAAFRDLSARGFGLPTEFTDVLVTAAMVDDPDLGLVVGTVDATPVSCALVAITGATAGIYNVATPPEFRRRGYGAALTWAAIAEGARRGCDHSILQASEMGAPVYRAMGFVDVGTYVQLEGPRPQ